MVVHVHFASLVCWEGGGGQGLESSTVLVVHVPHLSHQLSRYTEWTIHSGTNVSTHRALCKQKYSRLLDNPKLIFFRYKEIVGIHGAIYINTNISGYKLFMI